MNTSQIILWH